MRTWLYIAACVAAASLAAAASAEDVAVRAAVEKTDAFVGEPFIFQIQVQGNDHPDAPDVSALSNDFDVQTLGGQTNNSQSVTVVNGRMSTTVQRAYVFNYRLSPKRTGVLNIPAMTLTVDGKAMSTQPIQLTGRKPEETQDFKFRLEHCLVNHLVAFVDCIDGLLEGLWVIEAADVNNRRSGHLNSL